MEQVPHHDAGRYGIRHALFAMAAIATALLAAFFSGAGDADESLSEPHPVTAAVRPGAGATADPDGAAARADDGLARAMLAYENGEYAKATRLLVAPARNGNAEAQELLGFIRLSGETLFPGVERDRREAMRWFDLAARQGQPGARYMHCVLQRRFAGIDRRASSCFDWVAMLGRPGPAGSELATRVGPEDR